jgi:hypothetical protein
VRESVLPDPPPPPAVLTGGVTVEDDELLLHALRNRAPIATSVRLLRTRSSFETV